MVACAAVSQSQVLLAVPMTACALFVDQLKEQLLSAVENGQSTDIDSILLELEKAPITKEVLEATRVGLTVNEARKKIADRWPDLSKRCRGLIKSWQKLVEVAKPPSCASSANGTPNLVSPSLAKLGRKVTPGTPVNRRVTSTGLPNGRGSTVSPANGSYAPKELASPNGSLHKSYSVGTDLLAKGEEARNGKRKLEETNNATPCSIKRNKTVVGLATHSISASRMAVQSTSELVAQLSQNLPEHMSIDSSIRQHEEKVKREQQDEELAISLHGGVLPSPYVQPERKKRKYERKQLKEQPAESPPTDERRGGLILRLPRMAPVKEEQPDNETDIPPVLESKPISRPPSSMSRPESRVESGKKTDWMAVLQSMKDLDRRAEESRTKPNQVLEDPKKVYLLKVRDREVLALPYLDDVTSVPDFIQYKYPDAAQYYSEENFVYGAERDV